jgi:hypothetical protein
MNPIRRELLNGLFVLVLSTLLSAGFAAFQVKFDVQLMALILMAVAVAVGGYIGFELILSNQEELKKTEQRELEWLKRVGTPARLELNREDTSAGIIAIGEVLKSMSPGGDYTVMYYFGAEGGSESAFQRQVNAERTKLFSLTLELLKRGTIREYKRIICFDHEVLANDHELKSGVLRVGEGPGTIDREMGNHCRLMMETKGCSLYVAPAVLRMIVTLCGVEKASIGIDNVEPDTGARKSAGVMVFCDPPNGEIIEQFRQMERETERRMVAVHKIVFPEDATAPQLASR